MKHLVFLVAGLTLIASVLLLHAHQTANAQATEAQRSETTAAFEPWMLNLFGVLPEEATPNHYQRTEALVNLGRMLYYDPRLSINHEMSCNTCHLLDRYGVDNLARSLGHTGEPVGRNSPTVYNAAFHVAQFWDGRSPNVEEQAAGPIMAAAEMGMPSPEHVVAVLGSIPGYVPLFATAFPNDPNPMTLQNGAIAIGAFERGLVTPSRFDAFLQGDTTQLSEQEQRGLATFVTVGCITCHAGPTVGGDLFRQLGIVEPYETEDLGRFEFTGNEADRYVFKVPSLRNITQTGPYLHDGSVETLEEMVQIMGKYQLGRELSDAQVADIIAFLDALTGEIPHEYIALPELPESGPDTPAPGGG